MISHRKHLPKDLPEIFKRSDEDTPVPAWEQVTRKGLSTLAEREAHIFRVIAGTDDEQAAKDVWESWPATSRRSVALLVDKISHEGWIDAVGPIRWSPWDGGFRFLPRMTGRGTLADILDSKSGQAGAYTGCRLRTGLFAYLAAWNHRDWQRSWMETDEEMAALHIGLFKDGSAEVHLDAFNPLYINGATRRDVVRMPFAGSFNLRLYLLHRRWEQSRHASITRTSANFYHLMRGRVPLSF
jgi:hypothetical protein